MLVTTVNRKKFHNYSLDIQINKLCWVTALSIHLDFNQQILIKNVVNKLILIYKAIKYGIKSNKDLMSTSGFQEAYGCNNFHETILHWFVTSESKQIISIISL